MIAALALMTATFVVPPTPTHYVTDTVNALSDAKRDALESELHDFDAKTHNQIIVYIADRTGSTPLEEYTAQAAETWKIGHKSKNSGAVLFLFMKDHKARIEVGYGLEPTLTDAKSAQILNGIILPAMRSGDVDGAVQGGVDGMLAAVDPSFVGATPNAAPSDGDSANDESGEGIAALVVGGIFLLLFFAIVVTIVRRGKKHGDWMDLFLMSSAGGPSAWSSGGGFGGGGFSGGGFSAGGGGFGGGGASGSW